MEASEYEVNVEMDEVKKCKKKYTSKQTFILAYNHSVTKILTPSYNIMPIEHS